jgi:hypothetical protein
MRRTTIRLAPPQMMNAAVPESPEAALDENAWEDLLSFIEERRVIPIVGPELLMIASGRGCSMMCSPSAWRCA